MDVASVLAGVSVQDCSVGNEVRPNGLEGFWPVGSTGWGCHPGTGV